MADKPEIKTKFTLEGFENALANIKAFSKQAKDGFDRAKDSADAFSKKFGAFGKAAQVAAGTVKVAMKSVEVAISAVGIALKGVGKVAEGVFKGIEYAATKTAGAVKAAFSHLFGGGKEGLADLLSAQLGGFIGAEGLELKLALEPSTAGKILKAFGDIAKRVTGLFESALAAINPQRLIGVLRRALRVARFGAIPAIGAAGVAYKGQGDIKSSTEEAATAGANAGIPNGAEYSKLDGIFRQVGGSGADATEVVSKFNDAVADIGANGGNSKFSAIFDQAGISVTNFDGTLKTGYQLFNEYWAKFAAVPGGGTTIEQLNALKAGIAGIVGNSKALIPLDHVFGKSAEAGGLDQLVNNVTKFGVVIGPEQVYSMNRFSEGLGNLMESFRGVAIQLATVVGPGLGTFFTALANIIAGHRDGIVDGMRSVLTNVVQFSGEVIAVITGMDKELQEGSIGEDGSGSAGYEFRYHWLITMRDFALKTWGVMQEFFGFLGRVGPPILGAIESAFSKLTPYGDKIATAFGAAIAYIGRFIEAIADLAAGSKVTPEFEWIPKLGEGLKTAGEWIEWAYDKFKEFNESLKDNPQSKALVEWLKQSFKDIGHYVYDLAQNIKLVATGHEASDGFKWIQPVAAGIQTLAGWFTTAGAAFLGFVAAIGGNEKALADNPGLAAFRATLIDDIWPRLKTFIGNAVQFLTAIVPPVFATIEGVIEKLKPYLDSVGSALKTAGDEVVKIFESIAQYFAGEKIAPDMAWVATVLNDIAAVGRAFVDVRNWIAGAFKALTAGPGADVEKQFDWVVRVKDYVITLKNAFISFGNGLSWLTGGTLSPAVASIGLLFGLFALGKVNPILQALGLLAGGFGRLGKAIFGAATNAGSFKLPSLAGNVANVGTKAAGAVTATEGVIGAVGEGAGALAATNAARGAGAIAAGEAAAGGLFAPFMAVMRWAGWVGLLVTLDQIVDHFTGINKKIADWLTGNNKVGGDGFDRQRAALDDLAAQTADANRPFMTGQQKMARNIAEATPGFNGTDGVARPYNPWPGGNNGWGQGDDFNPLSAANQQIASDRRVVAQTAQLATLRDPTPAEKANGAGTGISDPISSPAAAGPGGAGGMQPLILQLNGKSYVASMMQGQAVQLARAARQDSDGGTNFISGPVQPASVSAD